MAFYECGGGLPTQTKSTVATTSQQIIRPDTGYSLSQVTVDPQVHSGSATPTTRTSTYDLGQKHNVRYINTNSVPNSNSSYYPSSSSYDSVPQSSSGKQIDLGATNSYRYVRVKADAHTEYKNVTPFVDSSNAYYTYDMGAYHTTKTIYIPGAYTKKVWTNSSPTSNFSSRTITLDYSTNYGNILPNDLEFLMVKYNSSTSSATSDNVFIPLKRGTNLDGFIRGQLGSWVTIGNSLFFRTLYLDNTGSYGYTVEISDGKRIEDGGTTNSRLIPIEMYIVWVCVNNNNSSEELIEEEELLVDP